MLERSMSNFQRQLLAWIEVLIAREDLVGVLTSKTVPV